ncbi:hypothetical protein AMELA_G00231400 [Ameiurus melas]|uniref:Neuron-specific protein family member 1 n=1 Tax=Ameiurus melas TaxID=219545 RepID=A0A7J5ZZ26_AMEME|nr:hypothetical protein AMELA_G00231400 [Ameiurus melas]
MCEYANNSIDLQIRLLCAADIIHERQLVTGTRVAPGCVTHCACAVQNDDAASAESGIATPSARNSRTATDTVNRYEVNQLQKPFPDKVIVKTTTEYQLQKKQKKRLYMPSIKKLNINLYDEVSEKVKLTGLILITLAFLACLLLLVMYKALWYDQLSCPEGFILKHKHCTPAALEMYYPEQDAGSRGSLYTAISHLNPAKKALPELSSPWLPVINAMKESQKAKGEASHSQQ